MLNEQYKKAIVFFLISLILLLAAFLNVELIPINMLLLVFGLPNTEMGFIVALLCFFLFTFVIHVILGIYASMFPKKRKWAENQFLGYFKQLLLGFIIIILIILTITIISIINIYSLPLSFSQFVYLYLFWFFSLKCFGIIFPVKTRWQGYR